MFAGVAPLDPCLWGGDKEKSEREGGREAGREGCREGDGWRGKGRERDITKILDPPLIGT